jgi:hypothetical protein
VCHRTVSGAPGWINSNSPPFGFLEKPLRYNSPDCPVCQRSNDYSATVDSNENLKSATVRGQFAQKLEQRQKAHLTVNSTCPVHHRTVWWPRLSELQRSNPNNWVTWLAHRTVSGAPIDSSPTPTVGLVIGAINTPNHHHSRYPSFQPLTFNTRALDFTPRHKQEIKSSPKSKITPTLSD